MLCEWFAWWNIDTCSFYAAINDSVDNRWVQAYMHRQILGLSHGDQDQVDHIHHNTLDNRKSQLRIVSRSENQWNRSNVKGYYFHKKSGKYVSQISVNCLQINLGSYDTEEEARSAYLAAKEKYHTI